MSPRLKSRRAQRQSVDLAHPKPLSFLHERLQNDVFPQIFLPHSCAGGVRASRNHPGEKRIVIFTPVSGPLLVSLFVALQKTVKGGNGVTSWFSNVSGQHPAARLRIEIPVVPTIHPTYLSISAVC